MWLYSLVFSVDLLGTQSLLFFFVFRSVSLAGYQQMIWADSLHTPLTITVEKQDYHNKNIHAGVIHNEIK